MVKKHIKKGASQTGSSGREAVKGATGIAAAYITRTKAIKRLQITLKDFRRLCILKGIFPRDPKKKKEGKNKSYYHMKDIMYLQHEPLLQHFRDLKIFLRKFHKAHVVQDATKIEKMTESMPILTLDHLIRERYPSFPLALHDVNEALNLLFLFQALPTSVLKSFNEVHIAVIEQLLKEFLYYVTFTHSLRAIFVSIKGIYVQVVIQSLTITFIMPHQTRMLIPNDVDYRVMFTFLQFYEVLMKFVHCKLYHDAGLQYPPTLDASKQDLKYGFSALLVQKAQLEEAQQLDASVESEFAARGSGANEQSKGDDEQAQASNAQADDRKACSQVFAQCIVLLSREVHAELLALCLRSGGAQIVWRHHEMAGLSEEERASVTHIIIDRPDTRSFSEWQQRAVHFVQPQWAIDSFNLRHLCPVSIYAPGKVPPPHLSPFVDDAKEGYIPKQREVLEAWKAGKSSEQNEAESVKAAQAQLEAEKKAAQVVETAEERYERELELERSGISYSQHLASLKDDEEEKEEEEDAEEDDEAEAEAEDEESEEEEQAVVASAPAIMAEDDLPKIMMKKKDAKLYNRIQYGIQRRQRANQSLVDKRKQAESAQVKPSKRAKRARVQ